MIDKTKCRELRVGEVIANGDVWDDGVPCVNAVGLIVPDKTDRKIYRPIPASTVSSASDLSAWDALAVAMKAVFSEAYQEAIAGGADHATARIRAMEKMQEGQHKIGWRITTTWEG